VEEEDMGLDLDQGQVGGMIWRRDLIRVGSKGKECRVEGLSLRDSRLRCLYFYSRGLYRNEEAV